jgi:RNA polymerase sigma factor (sigma-70 family)
MQGLIQNAGSEGRMMDADVRDLEGELASLLCAALKGDERAYALFLKETTCVLRSMVALRHSSLPQDGQEDILQEILMALHAKRHTWDADTSVLIWIRAIARYKLIDIQRRRALRTHVPLDIQIRAEPGAEDVPAVLAARDSESLLARLDPRSARIVRAVSLEGDSMAEVGHRLSMSEGAIRVALHRAIKRLAAIARKEDT